MRFTASIAAAILAFSATGALARPTPQLAGEGAAANSILSDTDNGIGYGTENAEDNIAKNIASITGNSATSGGTTSSGGAAPPPPPPRKRQLAGEGAAADSILSDTDNGIGYGVEDAEDNLANNIASVTGGSATSGGTTSSGGAPPPPPGPKARRQLDKISNGLGAIGNAAGAGAVTDPVASAGDSVDGTLTSDAANAGAEIGQTEETTLENAGSSVPKSRRQLDKISNGLGAIGNAAGAGAVTDPVASAGDSVDGTLTSDAANAGAEIGQTEETTLENAGSSVPKL